MRLSICILVAAVVCAAAPLAAQDIPSQITIPLQPEVRVDLIAGSTTALHAGAGVTVPIGTYVRAGVIGGVGASSAGFSGRVDVIGRFNLDPYRAYPWSPYLGGGTTTRFDDGPGTRTYLLLFGGLEGPPVGSVIPAVELGVGGGLRLGVILRGAGSRPR